MLKPFRCQICGETYMGSAPADRCPFCGAAGKNLKAAAEWIDYSDVEVSEESKELLQEALKLEIDNAGFYQACAKTAETQISEGIFKRLSKQELEHAEVFADLLGIEEPVPEEPQVPKADIDKFSEAHRREQRAIKVYLDSANQAVEPRIQEVFRGISEIESEHMMVSNLHK